ncbi:MAG: DsbA family protein [Thermoleophilia bacterium]
MSNREKYIIEIIQYTDPYCTWCWGSEPVMRHIEETYGDQVRFGFVMGGLVEDAAAFQDPLNHIGGPEMAAQVAKHWEEASQRHGMPVDARVWLDMKDEFTSTWPANIAYKAAQIQDEEKANRYLRHLREAAAAEHMFIHRREVQAQLAAETGLDPEQLIRDIESGAAEAAFMRDHAECRDKDVTGYPSFLIRNREGDEFMFFGFQPFSRFVELFGRLAGDHLSQREISSSDEEITAFVHKYGKVAPREAAEVFSLKMSEARERLDRLASEGKLGKRQAGNGWFYLLP